MDDYFSIDYDKFKNQNTIIAYEYGYHLKKIQGKLLKYCDENPKGKFIIFKGDNNVNYNINCDKIIYWMTSGSEIFIKNKNACKNEPETELEIQTESNLKIQTEANEDNTYVLDKQIFSDNLYNSKIIPSEEYYPLAIFINSNFQGVQLTIYTTSSEVICGEVIFNYNYLIVLKSDEKTYYINPHEISYFY